MSPARKNAIETLKSNSGCEIIIVNPSNLETFNNQSYPIHESYEKLSLTHRSDYLRAYLMYHYGGGYSDIKPFSFDWRPIFEKLHESEFQFTGSRESQPDHIASADRIIKNSYNLLVTMQRVIFKPKTEFALEWLQRVSLKISEKSDQLKKCDGSYHPRATSYGIHGERLKQSFNSYKYPFEWNELCGRIFHKLCFESIGKFSYDIPAQYFPESLYR